MTLPENAECLLLDMDGTLIDTESAGPQTFINQLDRYHVMPTSKEQARFWKIWRREDTTQTLDEWLPEIARKYGIAKPPAEFLDEYFAMYAKGVIAAPALPGVDAFLRKTKASGKYRLAIVTSSPRQQVEATVAAHDWQDIFDVVVGSEDFAAPKPDPEPFTAAIKKLATTPEACVVFEDSRNGTLAGAAAGCYVVGVRAGRTKQQDLSAAAEEIGSFVDVELPPLQ